MSSIEQMKESAIIKQGMELSKKNDEMKVKAEVIMAKISFYQEQIDEAGDREKENAK